jgi:predicted LPLAT superfamily acyltransferase
MVLITGHRNRTSAKQHLFAFSDESIEKIAALIGGVSALDVGLHLNLPQNSDSFFYLIRRP